MDMRLYYRKIREQEQQLSENAVVVVSLETPDGGKPDVRTEVSRRNAATLIVEGRARRATTEEAEKFRQAVRDAKSQAERDAAARRMEFTFVPASETKNATIRPVKE